MIRLLILLGVVAMQGCTSPTAPSVYVCQTALLLQRGPDGHVTTSPSVIYRSHEPCDRGNGSGEGAK
jgi:hypothetical protein